MEETDNIQDTNQKTSMKEVLRGEKLALKLKNNSVLIVFVGLLVILYIANGYSMEKLHRERMKLENEVRDLRFESISAAADLMFIQKQSEVLKQIEREGMELEESKEPPIKLYR